MRSSSESKVQFFNQGKIRFSLLNRTRLKKFIIALLKKEGRRVKELNYIFCSDSYLLKLNKQFLNHHDYTDVLTFDLSEGEFLIAEVYISIDRVRANSKEEGVSFQKELLRVILHGALHLAGYNDKTKKDRLIIRQKENFYLKSYF